MQSPHPPDRTLVLRACCTRRPHQIPDPIPHFGSITASRLHPPLLRRPCVFPGRSCRNHRDHSPNSAFCQFFVGGVVVVHSFFGAFKAVVSFSLAASFGAETISFETCSFFSLFMLLLFWEDDCLWSCACWVTLSTESSSFSSSSPARTWRNAP